MNLLSIGTKCVLSLVLVSNGWAGSRDLITPEWVEKWSEDLQYGLAELKRLHPDPFHSVSEDDLGVSVRELRRRLPTLTHHQIVVELAGIMAMIRDGHTRLTLPYAPGIEFFRGHSSTPDPHHPDLLLHQFPIRFGLFSDGLYVVRVDVQHREVLGGRVTRIGELPTEEALEAVGRIVQRDNGMQVKHHLPERLVVPEILHALEVIPDIDRARFEIELEDRKQELVLEPALSSDLDWVDARHRAVDGPLYLTRSDEPYWFQYLEDSKVVYVQYNEVTNTRRESTLEFTKRLFEFFDRSRAEALILDLRNNRGGSNGLNQPLIHEIIRCRKLQERGRLFTIIGRSTFSAAMMLTVDLEKHTRTIFVGEDTGSSPNHYGDSRRILLPNTGLTLRVSTLYWQYSDPRDRRPTIHPHIRVEPDSSDYFSRRDSVMETILELLSDRVVKPAGRWKGEATISYRRLDASITLEESGSGWNSRLEIPALGLDMRNDEVHLNRAAISFDFSTPTGAWVFVGRIMNDRIIGEIGRPRDDFPRRRYPIVLRRE